MDVNDGWYIRFNVSLHDVDDDHEDGWFKRVNLLN